MIIPCYNEEHRLQVREFSRGIEQGLWLCFADDGSKDQTWSLLQSEFQKNSRVKLFKAPQNLGKAAVIREAVLDTIKSGFLQQNEIQWVGYWDADLATPLSEVPYFLDFHKSLAPQTKALFGSRILRLGASIERSAKRHYLGRMFATLASIMLRIHSYDSQCGAKLFHVSILESVFREGFLSRWIFDVELLLRTGEDQIVEVPLRAWRDVPGSKVKVAREVFRVFQDLLKIRSRYLKNQ